MVNYKKLKQTCLRSIPSFKEYGKVEHTQDGIFIHNLKENNKVLGVAHLDTVLSLRHFFIKKIGESNMVFSAQLDDRLGAYVLLHLLPQMGIEFDLLLTEGEEMGASTAVYFDTQKEYNWMFSFDRRGNDVVMYQYDNKSNRQLLKKSGFRVGLGSFSDIAFLDHLRCTGFNFGVGYMGEHTKQCCADLDVTLDQVAKFADFYRANKDIKLPYEPEPLRNYRWHSYGQPAVAKGYGWDDEDTPFAMYCGFCFQKLEAQDLDYGVCEGCALDHGIYCELCSRRLNLQDAQRFPICAYCEKKLD